jgi:hypothetical protein
MSRIESPAVSQLAFNRLRERRSIRFHLRLSMGATPNAGNCNRSDRWLRTRVRCSRVDFPPTASSGETATFLLSARVRRRAGVWHSLGSSESIGPLEHPASVIVTFSNVDPGAKTMSEINWDERVQVQIIEPVGIKNYSGYPGSAFHGPGTGRQPAVESAAPLSRHHPHDAWGSGSGFGAAPRSEFAFQRQPCAR